MFIKIVDAKTTILGLVEKASKDFKVEKIKKYWLAKCEEIKFSGRKWKKKKKFFKFIK